MTITVGKLPKTSNEYSQELQDLLGAKPPITLHFDGSTLIRVDIEEEWDEGETVAIEAKDDANENAVDYQLNSNKQKLTPEQIKIATNWITANIEG